MLVLLAGITLIITTIGLIALVAPPNTWDSMTYHMSRVVHWQQNHSVSHYSTSIPRQLYQNPWAEFTIMHLQILSESDRFANLVQWFSMTGSLIGVSLIAKELEADLRGQIFAVVVAGTIPMGILQGSSTQNDYVVAFWIICLVYYTILTVKSNFSWFNILAIGLIISLAILTKATAYIYILPIFLWFIFSLLKYPRWQAIKSLVTVFLLLFLINLGHWLRNFNLYGTPIAADSVDPKYTNEIFSTSVLLSNILRNIGLHLGTPFGILNGISNKIITLIHQILSVQISDPRTTYEAEFGIPGGLATLGINASENHTSNTIHFLLIFITILIFFTQKKFRKNSQLFSYLIVCLGIFIIFCFLLKWQWYHSRLHVTIFLLFSPFVAVILTKINQRKLINFLAIFLLLAAIPWITLGRERTLIGEHNIFNTNRIEQYFVSRAYLKNDYINAVNFIQSRQCYQLGLYLDKDDFEYPLWILLQNSDKPVNIQHINPANTSAILKDVNFIPCAVFSTKKDLNKSSEISVNQHKYIPAWSSNHVKIFMNP